MKAIRIHQPGDADAMVLDDLPMPEPGPGEIRVRVEAAGVNFIDVYQREGVYPTSAPFVLGQEGSGAVAAVGPEVDGVAIGDRVAWPFALGSAASHASVSVRNLVRVPDGVDLETAAAVMLQGLTAHYLTRSTYAVQPGTVALVHAAAGGVGQLLVQMVKALGGVVIATAGSDEKCSTAAGLGADHAINYRTVTDLAAAVRAANGGTGVDVAYDGVGRDTFDASLASLRPRGLLALYGAASGQVPPFDLQRLNAAGSVFVTRPSLPHHIATPDELARRAEDVLGAVSDGTLRVAIGGRYPLTDAAAAYRELESRRTQGKLILIP